jgi:hypothetical protein
MGHCQKAARKSPHWHRRGAMGGRMEAILRRMRPFGTVRVQRCTSTFLHIACILFGWPKMAWTKGEGRKTTDGRKRQKARRQASSTPEIQVEVGQRQEQDTGKVACVIVPLRDYYRNCSCAREIVTVRAFTSSLHKVDINKTALPSEGLPKVAFCLSR